MGELDPETRVSPGVEPGAVLAGKFRVERVINSGGMGVILVAHHIQLDQRVAIKVLRAHVLDEPEIVARFAREARIAAKIKSEHVVRVLDVGALPNGSPYMVMEHLQGSDLSALIKARGPLAVDEAVDYVLQACEALAEAHLAGIVHRDLKPANLFLTRRADGSSLLKVLDFGISKMLRPLDDDSALTRTAMMMGSPHYMSPEQLKSARNVDGRADIWGLGVVLYKLLSGANPFQADTTPELCVEILHGKPTPLAQVAPDVPAGLVEVIERCLEKKPAKRYADVAKLARALEPFAPDRAKASIERISGVYRAAPPAATDPSDEVGTRIEGAAKSTAERDTTDVGSRTLSQTGESVAASVSEPRVKRSGSRRNIAIAIAALAAGAAGTFAITHRTEPAAAPSAVSAALSPSVTASATPPVTVEQHEPAPTASATVTVSATATTRRTAVVPSATVAVAHSASAVPSASSPNVQSRFGGPF